MAAGNLHAELINAKETLELTKNVYENSYVANKVACDNTLNEINKKIQEAVRGQNRSIQFNYTENKHEENPKGWSYSYYCETCPLPTLKYQLTKRGYGINTPRNLTDNHIEISW